jgi:hypothetical protein
MASPVSGWLRARELASDKRAGAFARGKARRIQYDYVRAHWRLLAGGVIAIVVPVYATSLLLPGGFVRGLFVGAVLAGTAGLIVNWVMQVTGTAPTMMGDTAEQWTASELRKLRKHGWRLVNGLRLTQEDNDHLLVGPGGVYVLETKWSNRTWRLSPPDHYVQHACQQAISNAHRVHSWLGRRRFTSVHPVVMLWGPGVSELQDNVALQQWGEVTILAGHKAMQRWRERLPSSGLAAEEVEFVWQKLDARVREVNPIPIPPSVDVIAGRFVGSIAAGLCGLLAVVEGVDLFRSSFWGLIAVLAAIGLGPYLLRIRRLRHLGLGWLTGVGFGLLLLLLDVFGVVHL